MRSLFERIAGSPMLLLVFTAFICSGVAVHAGECGDIVDLLKVSDKAFFTSYSIEGRHTFVDANNFSADDVMTLVATGSGNEQVLVSEQTPYAEKHDHLPIVGMNPVVTTMGDVQDYLRPGLKPHYIRYTYYLDGESNQGRYDSEWLEVADDRSIKNSTLGPPLLTKYGADPSSLWMHYRLLLPLGRGYADQIDEVVSCEIDEAGIATVEAKGHLFAITGGSWTLKIDSNAAYLVQSADFSAGSYHISIRSKGEILWDETKELPLYSSGSLQRGSRPCEVSLTSYSRVPNAELLADGKFKVNDASALGTQITDYTLRDSDNEAWKHFVLDTEEDK